MSKTLNKLMKASGKKKLTTMRKSEYMKKDNILTSIPILNVASSGEFDKGFSSGVTVFAGESRTFKTNMSLMLMAAYMQKYPDAVAIFYDSELGTSLELMEKAGIDLDRVIHNPITDIEELKFDMVKHLENIERGERVFLLTDSIGNLASKKEVEDAENEKSVQDMTRAKQIKSLFRIVTPKINASDIPAVFIAHTYKEQTLYPKDIISGGQGILLSCDTAFVITRSQQKDGKELAGYDFNLNVYKSRFVREKSKLPITVTYDKGVHRFSGLFDLALDVGAIVSPKQGFYAFPGDEENCWRRKKYENDPEFWDQMLASEYFKEKVKAKFKLGYTSDDVEELEDELEDEENPVEEV